MRALIIAVLLSLSVPVESGAQAEDFTIALRKLGRTHRLLYVTAHPDDEDNRLLAYYLRILGDRYQAKGGEYEFTVDRTQAGDE